METNRNCSVRSFVTITINFAFRRRGPSSRYTTLTTVSCGTVSYLWAVCFEHDQKNVATIARSRGLQWRFADPLLCHSRLRRTSAIKSLRSNKVKLQYKLNKFKTGMTTSSLVWHYKSNPRSFTSSSWTASMDYCLDRFFWATRFLLLFFPYFVSVPCGRALN